MRLLNDAMQTPSNVRLLELTMKCQWKVLKQFGIWTKENPAYDFDTEGFLNEFYFFMKSHPFSSFNSQDATPLKTMKTIIHAVVLNLGPLSVQTQMTKLPELKNSEAGLYLNKLVTREVSKLKNGPTAPIQDELHSNSNSNTAHQNNNLQRKY